MQGNQNQAIVIKKIKKGGHGFHGGAWKLAYADFVTAMMAFFLLMWLLGSVSKETLAGIASYFQNPTQVSLEGGKSVGMSSSLIDGGGDDLTKSTGQVHKSDDIKTPKMLMDKDEAKRKLMEEDAKRIEELKKKIEDMIQKTPSLKEFEKQLKLEITREGLRIQIVDEAKRPMFRLGSSDIEPYARQILTQLAPVINELPNRITMLGHTDSRPFQSGDRTNWELSSERANAARRALVSGGLEERKVLRVAGVSDSLPYDRQDPFNPINRRIAIIVMNKQAEEETLLDNLPSVKLGEGQAPAGSELAPPVPSTPARP
ncbi:MAG: flagellar motor protein MotB [Halothiobacillaceae bacterium]|jgi:chemotaxis protein MotB|nr:flagellar motor protein MotB [Halothiobacillaceae bacterium]MDY0050673.1 flagellar motor protein MotB [Halothiobacillaceae bacterium]